MFEPSFSQWDFFAGISWLLITTQRVYTSPTWRIVGFILTPPSCGLSLSTGKVQIKHAALWIVGEMGVCECDQVYKMGKGLKLSLHYNTLQPLSVCVLISARRRRMRREWRRGRRQRRKRSSEVWSLNGKWWRESDSGLSNQEELEIKGTPSGATAPSCWKEALRRFKQLIRTPPHLPLEDLRENLS